MCPAAAPQDTQCTHVLRGWRAQPGLLVLLTERLSDSVDVLRAQFGLRRSESGKSAKALNANTRAADSSRGGYDNRLTLGDATALSTLVETSCLTDIYTEGRARFESLVESMDEIHSAVAVEVAAERAAASGSGN